MRKLLLVLLAPLLMAVSDYDMSEYDVLVNSLTCVGSPCGVGGGGGGDNVTVNGLSMSDVDLIDTTTIAITRDTAPSPDTAAFAVIANSIGPTQIDETATYTWSGASTITNATIDGVDAGSGTTRSNEAKILIPSHNTSCTSLTDGAARELCYEESTKNLYICQPTAGGCDTPAEWIPASNSIHINTANFVGTVFCPDGIPSSGTQAGCTAIVTSINGTTLTNAVATMRGTYNVSTPHTTSAGFIPDEFILLPTCTECGTDFQTLSEAAHTIGNAYDQDGVALPPKPRIRLLSALYPFTPNDDKWFKVGRLRQTIDFCNAPSFSVSSDPDDPVSISGTCTVTVGTDARLLTCSSASFFNGDGNGEDGDEPLRPGDKILLTGTGNWYSTGQVVTITELKSETTLEFEPPLTGDYSGGAEGSRTKFWEVDGTAQGLFSNVDFLCPDLAMMICSGTCTPRNPWEAGQDTSSYRELPMQGLVVRGYAHQVGGNIRGLFHRYDSSVTFTNANTAGGKQSYASSTFVGTVAQGVSAAQWKHSWTGYDDTTTSDDGISAAFSIFTPGVTVRAIGLVTGGVWAFLGGDNCTNEVIDATPAENYHRIIYAPSGCQDVSVTNVSQEQDGNCSMMPSGCPTALSPIFEFGNYGDPTTPPFYDLKFHKLYIGSTAARPLLKVDDNVAMVNIEGGVDGTNQLLNLTSGVIVTGHLYCDGTTGTACDLDTDATYQDFSVYDKDDSQVSGAVAGITYRKGTATDIDACTSGLQGAWWWDSVDSQFEFCETTSGTPFVVVPDTPGDDRILGSTGASAMTWLSLPDSDGATQKLQYDQATNTFSAGTDDDVPEAGDFTNLSATAPITQSGGTISTSMSTNRLIGRTTASTGVMEEITVASPLTLTGLTLDITAIADSDLASNYSGVGACSSNQWASTLNDNAAPTCTQPAFSNLSGTASDAQVNGANESDEITLGLGLRYSSGIGLDPTASLSGDHTLSAGEAKFGANGLIFEGSSADTAETYISITNPTADRTVTIPNADSTTVQPLTCTGTDKVSAISSSGVITCSADSGGSGGSPGGSNTQVQYNSSGSFAGASTLTFGSSTSGAAFSGGGSSAGTWPTLASGTLLSTAADDTIENDGNVFYLTTDAGNRGYVPARNCIRADSTRSLTSSTSEQALFNSPTNGRLTLETGTYLFNGALYLSGMSGTSGNAAIDPVGAGTATTTAWLWMVVGLDNTTVATVGNRTGQTVITQQTAASAVTAGAGTAMTAFYNGTVEVTGAGTFIPSVTLVTAAAATVNLGTFFCIERIGSTSMTNVGQWD